MIHGAPPAAPHVAALGRACAAIPLHYVRPCPREAAYAAHPLIRGMWFRRGPAAERM
jgi:hypothetical protein